MGLGFKGILANDINRTFMNPEEFGEPHMLNGSSVNIIIDNNEMVEREKRYAPAGAYKNGVTSKQILFYVAAEVFGPLPQAGRILTLDRQTYSVTDAINENGIYSISLEAAKG